MRAASYVLLGALSLVWLYFAARLITVAVRRGWRGTQSKEEKNNG